LPWRAAGRVVHDPSPAPGEAAHAFEQLRGAALRYATFVEASAAAIFASARLVWMRPSTSCLNQIRAQAFGFRARARIKAYRLRPDCTGDYRVYTRVALLPKGKRRKTVVLKPDTCAG
jgi:hypothetical protein